MKWKKKKCWPLQIVLLLNSLNNSTLSTHTQILLLMDKSTFQGMFPRRRNTGQIVVRNFPWKCKVPHSCTRYEMKEVKEKSFLYSFLNVDFFSLYNCYIALFQAKTCLKCKTWKYMNFQYVPYMPYEIGPFSIWHTVHVQT